MLTWTNLAQPGDPYRTGQRLYRKPAPLLAAITARQTPGNGDSPSTVFAVVYLPLHRTRALPVSEGTLAFGFRAASVRGGAGMAALAEAAGLDLMAARSHAAVLAGHDLPAELAFLTRPGAAPARGLAAAGQAWAGRDRAGRGTPVMIDSAADLPGGPALDRVCELARIISVGRACRLPGSRPAGAGTTARIAVERALAIALACARHLGRCEWEGTLDTASLISACAWDCFPETRDEGETGAA